MREDATPPRAQDHRSRQRVANDAAEGVKSEPASPTTNTSACAGGAKLPRSTRQSWAQRHPALAPSNRLISYFNIPRSLPMNADIPPSTSAERNDAVSFATTTQIARIYHDPFLLRHSPRVFM